MKAIRRTGCIAAALLVLFAAGTARAQLSRQFSGIFETILKDRLLLSSGTHSSHFFQAAAQADSLLSPALNSLIVSNISSFPLSSTTPGISFSFAGGELVSVTEGLGPIFADRATTTGKGRINIGFNATYLDLTRFRGLATDEMRFTFAHQDLNGDNALGGNDPLGSTEGDLIDVTMGTSIQAYIFALGSMDRTMAVQGIKPGGPTEINNSSLHNYQNTLHAIDRTLGGRAPAAPGGGGRARAIDQAMNITTLARRNLKRKSARTWLLLAIALAMMGFAVYPSGLIR